MPALDNIAYSHDQTVAAFRSYYSFLTKMYLNESHIINPPSEGWITIIASPNTLDKTDKVVNLLRHLPYMRITNDDTRDAEGAPYCKFADWQKLSSSRKGRDFLKLCTENASICEDVPRHVVGLTAGGRYNPVFLLDVELGTVTWYECRDEISEALGWPQVEDDPYDYAPEKEAEWRAEGATWAISDFFEMMKDQYRKLHFIPISPRMVIDEREILQYGPEGMIQGLQKIFREHGWPDLERYCKKECLDAVQAFLEEHYPEEADRRNDARDLDG
ncbi:hypothetical protein EJ04DRAFT_502520 [Polyplosphaeria fusca]|uniref:Uncharacterized protein n=1 Tax=Polyplosphaeria fusca TaxID=682080 RepID=A0A9P4QMZ6_9PLEO|nr:hypothetical protein EJ04DRAFT_502520 [Polyplosphaeria fusca]